MRFPLAAIFAFTLALSAYAGEADVVEAKASQTSDGVWRFDVTVRHADEGWEHYADAFEIVLPDGTVAGTRVLAHPHVEEQPFTRSLGSVAIPAGIERVIIRAKDSVHGLGGKEVEFVLPR